MTNNEEKRLLAFVNALKPVTENQDMKFNFLQKYRHRWGYFTLGHRKIWFEIEHDLVLPCKEDIENHDADLLIVLHNNIELYCLLSYLKRILYAPISQAYTSLNIDKQTKTETTILNLPEPITVEEHHRLEMVLERHLAQRSNSELDDE